MMKSVLEVFLICLVAVGCRHNSDRDPFKRFEGEAFATHYRITYQGSAEVGLVREAVEEELERIDRMASTWRSDSELMRYNRANDKSGFELSVELKELLDRSNKLKNLTEGAFDIRFDGYQYDLSAIAKGYAVDRVTTILEHFRFN